MTFFYTPFLYFYKTRLKSKEKLISWFMIYIVPLLLLTITKNDINLINYSLVVTITYILYEIGYIMNDCETTKKEKKPTLRINKKSMCYYEEHKKNIYILRFSLATTLMIICSGLGIKEIYTLYIIIIIYLIYNNVRSVYNLPLHFFLVMSRYSLVIYIVTSDLTLSFFSILLFPLPNLLERVGEKRFNATNVLKWPKNNIHKFRALYYAITTIVSLILVIKFEINELLLYTSIFYFFYRFFVFKYSHRLSV